MVGGLGGCCEDKAGQAVEPVFPARVTSVEEQRCGLPGVIDGARNSRPGSPIPQVVHFQ